MKLNFLILRQPQGARLILTLILALSALSQVQAADKPAPTPGPELTVVDQFLMGIPKAGFGKEYLFTASLIPQERASTSTGLAGKIVRFELYSDAVDMYESTQG